MRKVILYIAMSLDGYIADSNGGVSWLVGEDVDYQGDHGYSEFLKSIDTVIMGMKTYRQVVEELSPDVWVYQGMKTYVLTHQKKENKEDIEFIEGDICGFVKSLKEETGKDIWICGGASIVNQLMKENLIDEYQISVMPMILGSGTRLFHDTPVIHLHLSHTTSENGVITSIYTRR